MEAINQLSQVVDHQIGQTSTELASLRTEIETSTTAVRKDMDSSKKEAVAVGDKIDILSELIKNETQDMIEEAMTMTIPRKKK